MKFLVDLPAPDGADPQAVADELHLVLVGHYGDVPVAPQLSGRLSDNCVDHDEFVNEILDCAPDSWDGDDAAESIAIDFVRHLVDQVRLTGGCLYRHCLEDEPCDHGFPRGRPA